MSTEILNYSSGKISAKLERSSKILLSDVHFSVSSGESVALIGETGSGKTMAALSIMGLLPTNVTMLDSRIIFCRREADPNFMKKLLGVELVYIPQNGAEFLNPSRKIKDHLFDSLRKLGCRRSEMHSHAVSALRVSGFEHREATEAYNDALQLKPNDLGLLRRRAGRYISTLQCAKALEGFERCMVMGGDRLDILYRIGLCRYLMHQYASACEAFLACFELCDDEMGIAVMYWHTLCSYKLEHTAALLVKYHAGMAVGHHTAYEKAVSVFAGARSSDDTYHEALNENNDLESVITLYGLCIYASYSEQSSCARKIMEQILQRDGFWPSYAYLAAWNDSFNFTE